jgi:hypothetical protein
MNIELNLLLLNFFTYFFNTFLIFDLNLIICDKNVD